MDFHEQLQRLDLPNIEHPRIRRATRLSDRLLGGYLKLFRQRLAPLKPFARVNGMPVYDLTQPPMDSEAGARVLRTGFDYVVLRRPARPISMVFMINAACDMHCVHCSARNHMRSGDKPLEYGEIVDLIDQFLALNGASVVITGGEPTLHPRLLDIVDHVPAALATTSMFTNGSRLTELSDELRAAGLMSALVSLDSDRAEEHDERRQTEGAFAKANEAMETWLAAGGLAGVSSYLGRADLDRDGFERMVALTERLGAHQLFMFDAVPTGALLHEQDNVLAPADRARVRDKVLAQNASADGPAVMGQSWVNSPDGFGCFAGFYQFYVTAYGDVTPCDFTPISFGNVREQPLEEIWRKMRGSEEWGERFHDCRMQDECFRARTVDLIPDGTPFPVPYDTIVELRESTPGAAARAGR